MVYAYNIYNLYMISYRQRKTLETILRKSPDLLSNIFVDLINPFRVKNVKKNINPKWITLFITNYCYY